MVCMQKVKHEILNESVEFWKRMFLVSVLFVKIPWNVKRIS